MVSGDPVSFTDGLAAIDESLGGNPDDGWLIDITGRGWLERKRTSGSLTRYWYQRWRYRDESLGGKVRKRSLYLAPYLGNEGAKEHGRIERHS